MKKRFEVKSMLEKIKLEEMEQKITRYNSDTDPDYDPFEYHDDLSCLVRELLQVLKEENRDEEYDYINEYYMKMATGEYLIHYFKHSCNYDSRKRPDDFQQFAIDRSCPPDLECFCEWLIDLFDDEGRGHRKYIVRYLRSQYNMYGRFTDYHEEEYTTDATSVYDILKKFKKSFPLIKDEDILYVGLE